MFVETSSVWHDYLHSIFVFFLFNNSCRDCRSRELADAGSIYPVSYENGKPN
jgi:hypothetical protein